MNETYILVAMASVLAGIGVGVLAFYAYRKTLDVRTRRGAQRDAERIVNRARSRAAQMEREAGRKLKSMEDQASRKLEHSSRRQKKQLQQMTHELQNKQSHMEDEHKQKLAHVQNRIQNLEQEKQNLAQEHEQVRQAQESMNSKAHQLQAKLEAAAQMSAAEARDELKKSLEQQARNEARDELAEIEKTARTEAQKKARHIWAQALSRYASEVATERTVSIVPLTSDEMKGKIIGREGRNIRSIEAACGVDLIVDDTPEAVVVSSFDPVRRETARLSLNKLMEDGRVHPARIEEVVSKVKANLTSSMQSEAEKALFDLGLAKMHPQILRTLGSLKYRHTLTQNLLKHCVEVAYIAGLLAAEIGLDVLLARRAGLLHDIGEGIHHRVEGSVAHVGAEFLKKYGEKELVVDAVRSMGGKHESHTALGHLLQAANNFSESRPGTSRANIDNYIKRLSELESIGNSFDGVRRTFALQSGKEIRVLVDSGKITDAEAHMLSQDVARKIERELHHSGEVKVHVVRHTRMVEYAK